MRSGSALRVMFFIRFQCAQFSCNLQFGDGGLVSLPIHTIALRTDPDDGEEPPALRAFYAVAKEEIAAAGGAEAAHEDVRSAQAGAEELSAIGFAEVEQNVFGRWLVARRHHVQPLDWIGLVAGAKFVEPFGSFGELRLKLGGDFGADLVAAATDRRADGGEEVSGLAAELHLHLAYGFDDDAREGAAPACVDSGDGAFFWIDEENRNAVGGLDTKEE